MSYSITQSQLQIKTYPQHDLNPQTSLLIPLHLYKSLSLSIALPSWTFFRFSLIFFSFFFLFFFFIFLFFHSSTLVYPPSLKLPRPRVAQDNQAITAPFGWFITQSSSSCFLHQHTLHQFPSGTAETATSAIDSNLLGYPHLEYHSITNGHLPYHPNAFTSIPLIWQHRFLHLSAKHTNTKIGVTLPTSFANRNKTVASSSLTGT